MLIAPGGLPGVGKSTLAAALARRLRAVNLRIWRETAARLTVEPMEDAVSQAEAIVRPRPA